MKIKFRVIISILLSIIFLTGCGVKTVAVQESLENIERYKTEVEQIVKSSGCDMSYENTGIDADDIFAEEWIIEINENERININFEFDETETDEVVERVSVWYVVEHSEEFGKKFDLELFVNIVNVFSGKKITTDTCAELIEDPKGEYSWEQEDLEYSSLLIGKQKFLNFFEDWSLIYRVDKEHTERLEFWGLTAVSTKY